MKTLGFKLGHMRWRQHDKDELSTTQKRRDIEHEFPFGWGEMCGELHTALL